MGQKRKGVMTKTKKEAKKGKMTIKIPRPLENGKKIRAHFFTPNMSCA